MQSDSTATAVLTAPDICESAGREVFPPLLRSAALEFQAVLQLLVERARFLTAAPSVAIALYEDEWLLYSAISGDSAPEAGKAVDISKEPIHRCIEDRKPVQGSAAGSFSLAVPIIRDEKVIGLFELFGESEFEDRDIQLVTRLTEMVDTAIDHRNAAAQAERGAFEQTSEPLSLWHAPDPTEPQSFQEASTKEPPSERIEVHKCASCAFPVSQGRKFCLDCEKNAEDLHPPAELFSTQEHESWLSAHEYTIASLLVTALALAIILWLR